MNNCGTSPLFIPTTINCQIRNLDAVDVAATNISCDNLTIAGEPISTVLQNIGESSPNSTTFVGTVTADTLASTNEITAIGNIYTDSNLIGTDCTLSNALQSNSVTTGTMQVNGGAVVGALNCQGDATVGGTLDATLSTPTQNNVTKIGTQTSFASSGNISQTGGTTTLQATTVASLSTTGNITQTSGSTVLKTTSVSTLGVTSNINQTGGAATLKATTVDSLSSTGNISQTGGTTTLQATTVASLATAGNISQTGASATTSLKATSVTTLAASGNATIGGTLGVTGNTTITGTLTVGTTTIAGLSGSAVSGSAGTWSNIPITQDRVVIYLVGISINVVSNCSLLLANGTCTGTTPGTNGNNTATWTTNTLYLNNNTTNQISANVKVNGFIEITRINATTHMVHGVLTKGESAAMYTMHPTGSIENCTSLSVKLTGASAGVSSGTVYYID